MNKLKKRAQILDAIIEAFTKKPETISYPFSPLKLPDGFRGAIIMDDPEKCTGCGLCVRNCPANALELEKETREEFRLIHYPTRCAYCGQCEESCRNKAISHTNQIVKPISNHNTVCVVLKDSQKKK